MKRAFFALFLCFFYCISGTSQSFMNGRRSIDIPFELKNNLIVVKITFNQMLPLKFIFDTGAEYTILTKREVSDMVGIRYHREFRILGADMQTELIAYLARKIHLKMGSFLAPNQDILVLQDDYFRFEELTGVEVHGILGANFFSKYIIRINYQRRMITLYDPAKYDPPSEKYTSFPLNISDNKPYVNSTMQLTPQDSALNLKLLLDTGAGIALLLHTNTHSSLRLPDLVIPGNIGQGLGGYLQGYLGRAHKMLFAEFELNNIVTNFQEITPDLDTSYLNGRNGILGNVALQRFDVILDYTRSMVYLKPNKKYQKKFRYDRSGISLIASGSDLNRFTIQNIVPDSPADQVGLQKGDRIMSINRIPAGFLSLPGMTRILQGKIDKRIRLIIRRDGKKMKKRFRLKELI